MSVGQRNLCQQNPLNSVNRKPALVNMHARLRHLTVLAFIILIGMLCPIGQAYSAPQKIGKRAVSSVRKQNKRYANACTLLEAKRNEKPRHKTKTVKFR